MAVAESSDLSLRDYLSVLRRRKGTIVVTILLTVGAATAFSLMQTPVYEAEAQVLVQPAISEQLLDSEPLDRAVDAQRALDNEIQVIESRSVRQAVEQQLGHSVDVSASGVGETDVIEIQARSTDAEQATTDANTFARVYLDNSRTQLVNELLTAGQDIQQKVDELNARTLQLDTELAEAPPEAQPDVSGGQTAERGRIESQLAFYAGQLDRLEVAANLAGQGGGEIIAEATVPGSPASPNLVRNIALAILAGLVVGLGLAFLREYLDDSIKDKEDLEAASLGLTTVALVPTTPGWRNRKQTHIVSWERPQSVPAEAYRTLRTSLQFLSLERPLRSLQVTSAGIGEGKTTTVANLAAVFAGAGQRVVVLDCDLRRPRLHEFFGIDNETGFTTVLLGEASLAEVVQIVPEQSRVAVLTSGPPPPNPAELLAGERARNLVEVLAEQSDLLIIDGPPVIPVSDALVLCGLVDATLLVATSGASAKRSVHRAVELLSQVDAHMVGTMLNQVDASSGYLYGAGYGYSYAPASNGADKRGSQRATTEA